MLGPLLLLDRKTAARRTRQWLRLEVGSDVYQVLGSSLALLATRGKPRRSDPTSPRLSDIRTRSLCLFRMWLPEGVMGMYPGVNVAGDSVVVDKLGELRAAQPILRVETRVAVSLFRISLTRDGSLLSRHSLQI